MSFSERLYMYIYNSSLKAMCVCVCVYSDGELGQFLHQSGGGGGGGGGGWGEWLVQLRSTYCLQLKKSVSLSSHGNYILLALSLASKYLL